MIENYGLINDRSPHLVADLCEIISYFENSEVSRADIETFLFEKGGVGLLTDLNLDNLDSAETNERFQALSEDVFRHLNYRVKAFGTYYPFAIDRDILVPMDETTPRHKIYAALLAFSRMKMFSPPERDRFARCFEELCLQAALGFASNWEVVHFGAGGPDRRRLGGKLKKALLHLSDILRDRPSHDEINALKEQNTGDGGLDIVIYRKWSDPARSVPCYFAQCAAQQLTWPEKKYEANPLNFDNYITFFHKPGVILFIPLCYRGEDGQWINNDGHHTILVDRKRLLDLIEERLQETIDQSQILNKIPMPFYPGCAVNVQ